MGFNHIAVLGAGAWGCALANIASRNARRVTLWARNPAIAAGMRAMRTSAQLPGTRIAASVVIAHQLAEAGQADAVLIAVPAQALREVTTALAPALRAATPLIACAKGIERGTHKFMTEVIAETTPAARAAILSGPSFAADVANGLPTAVTLAAADDALAAGLAAALGSPSFRLYHSTDIRGVEIGGAAKNVLAIAAGIVVGRGLGTSASAALTTRGFAELFRFGKAFGARPDTLVGLSGLGDLILTCSSPQSRNFSHGLALGRGAAPGAVPGALVEGVFTAAALVELAQTRAVEMPVATAVCAILDGRLSIDQAIELLLTRPFRAEG